MLNYKGYVGKVTVDFEDDVIHGEVVGLRDIITFAGNTPAEVKKAFVDSIDFYLAGCEKRGVEPDRPYSGKFLTRVEPELHRTLVAEAAAEGCSLNDLVGRRLARYPRSVSATLGEGFAEIKEVLKKRKLPANDPDQVLVRHEIKIADHTGNSSRTDHVMLIYLKDDGNAEFIQIVDRNKASHGVHERQGEAFTVVGRPVAIEQPNS